MFAESRVDYSRDNSCWLVGCLLDRVCNQSAWLLDSPAHTRLDHPLAQMVWACRHLRQWHMYMYLQSYMFNTHSFFLSENTRSTYERNSNIIIVFQR